VRQKYFNLLKKLILASGVIILAVLASNLLRPKLQNSLSYTPYKTNESTEITEIKKTSDLQKQTKLYTQLIARVGPQEAQEELYKSGLPFDGETHLLNHAVGDYLYKHVGVSGLSECKEYFLGSCYHGFILDAFTDKGFPVLGNIMDDCYKQGIGIASQCAHAVGHGFLALYGYKNLPQALKGCDYLTNESSKFPTLNCYDGVFMENVYGLHQGYPSPDRWIKADDPFYPCDDPAISSKYEQACWMDQAFLLMGTYQGNLQKIANVCLQLKDSTLEATCFDNIARQIHPETGGSVDKAFQLCSLMPSNWQDPCVVSVANAALSVGDGNEPFQICARIDDSDKDNCYSQLLYQLDNYFTPDKKVGVCNNIEDSQWRQKCLSGARN
jgi:hypothetical protein